MKKKFNMELVSGIALKLLGILLLVAAVLKGCQLFTESVADDDILTYRVFMIFQVGFEVFLGIWLISGLFKKAVWRVALFCFVIFFCITLYKVIIDAESCGCFGVIQVKPWVTLFAIDMPAIIILAIFGALFES